MGPLSTQKAEADTGTKAAVPESKGAVKPAERYVEAVCRAIERLAAADNPGVLVAELTQSLLDHFDAVLAEVWIADPTRQEFSRQGARVRSGHAPPADRTLAQQYAALSHPISGPLDRAGEEFLNWAKQNSANYVLAHPMQVNGRPTGLLAVYSRTALPPEAPAWAQMYAAMAAATLDNTRVLSESRKAITQLQFLVEASQVLNSTLDLGELLDLILNLACKETNADRGSVFLVDRDKREIWSVIAHGLEEQEIRLAFGQGVAGHVAETGETLRVTDAYACSFFERSIDEKSNYQTQTLLCTPIRNRTGDIVGILQLLNKRDGPFTREDEEFLNALSVHMALALENARLHRELLEKQRLERELALARGIQRSLLPEAPPVVPGYDLAVLNEPCYEVGGDYYDFLTLEPHTLLLVVADVEGKGVSSALVMSNLQATLRALVMHLHSLEVITLSLNEMILADTHSEKFLSIFLGLVDTRRHGLHYINAGHIPPILVRADGEVLTLEEGGMVIGLFSAVDYRRGSLKLLPGDLLLCCTDGIIEACNAQHEEFGVRRLLDLVKAHRHLSAQQLVDEIGRQVADYARGSAHIDDKVLMVMKVLEELDPKV